MDGHLTGLIAPVHTPMHPDGAVNLDAVEPYRKLLARMGAAGVFVCGSTGEHVSLTVQERLQLAERWLSAGADFPRIIHVGHHALPAARRMAEHAREHGAEAIAAFPPCFFRLSEMDGLIEFCAQVAAAAPELPFYYYHIPTVTGVDFPMAAFLPRAAERIPTLAGAKFTSQNLVDYGDCLALGEGRFDLPYGWDQMLLGALALGARAGIGTTYNYAAPVYRRMMDAFDRGDMAAARAEQARARLLCRTILGTGHLAASKAVMGMLGVECGPARPPLGNLADGQRTHLRAELERIGFFDWIA